MKFNVVHPDPLADSSSITSQWTVTAGRGKVWKKGFNTWDEAHDFATLKSAEWHMEQVVKLVEKSIKTHPSSRSFTADVRAWEYLSDTGRTAQSMIDDIDTWARENDHQDPRGVERDWLA